MAASRRASALRSEGLADIGRTEDDDGEAVAR
jgi:hypothetical protein